MVFFMGETRCDHRMMMTIGNCWWWCTAYGDDRDIDIHSYIHTYIHACIHPSLPPSLHPSIHPSIHTYMLHTCIYIYMYICIQSIRAMHVNKSIVIYIYTLRRKKTTTHGHYTHISPQVNTSAERRLQTGDVCMCLY